MIHPSPLRVLLLSCLGLLHLTLADVTAAPKRLFELNGKSNGAPVVANSAAVVRAQLENKPVTGRVTPVSSKSFSSLTSVSKGQEIELPLAEGQTVTGIVNLVDHEHGRIRVAGHLTSETGSFALSLERVSVAGIVQLHKSGSAFRVETVANGNAQLRELLRSEVICFPLPRPEGLRPVLAPTPQEAVPVFDSRPNAVGVLYLDFDGAVVTDPLWNSGRTINAAPARMSEAQMTQVCERVAEDFWPFNVTVTTVAARYANAPVGRRMRCIVSPTNDAAPGAGGVAYLDSFSEAGTGPFRSDIPCWVFIDDDAKACAEAVSHEYGHTFGLRHDGRNTSPREEYFGGHNGPGSTGWAPIMGVGYYQPTVQWSKGEYDLANNKEDDLLIISNTKNGIGYVPDESTDDIEGALPLTFNGGNVNQVGLISKQTDVDYYVFKTTGGALSLAFNGATPSPNLDITVDLIDTSGNVLATSNPNSALNANLSRTLAAGDYFLRIEGIGVGNITTAGYSKYASIGAYRISGTIEGGSSSPAPVITSPGVVSALRGAPLTYTIKATGSPTSYAVVGTLPTWLTFNPTTATLSGTPDVSGVTNLIVQATNADGTGERPLLITVNAGAVSLGEALDAPNHPWISGGDDEWLGVLDQSFDGEDTAESGPIGDNEMTYMEAAMDGPGLIRFHWRTDSELDGDTLTFFIDGVEKKKISGQTGWVEDAFSFPVGPHTVRWEYRKNGSVSVGLDHGWVDTVSVTLLPLPVITSANSVIGEEGEVFFYQIEADNNPLSFGLQGDLPPGLTFDPATGIISGIPTGPATAQLTMTATNDAGPANAPLTITVTPPILTLGESVNAENMEPWVTTGSKPWVPQTAVSFDGMDAAQSGAIFNGQSSQIAATVIGGTAVRFHWKVSSEPKFDVLEFLIDGVVKASISGEADWQEVVFSIPSGRRTLAWRYRKDSAISAGLDAAWLDQVKFDLAPMLLSSASVNGRLNEPFFHRVSAVNNAFSFEAQGLPPGLVIDEGTGAITGTPTQTGEYPVNLTITNDNGVQNPTLRVVINETRSTGDLLRASTYTGLVRNGIDGKLTGMATIKLSAKQSFTGTLLVDRVRYSFRGKLDPLVPQALQLKSKVGGNLTLTLIADSRADVDLIRGSVQGGSGTSGFDAFATIPTTEIPSGAIGRYTMLVEPDVVADGLPAGTGSATLTLKNTGAVKATGVLGDGQTFSASSMVDINGNIAFYAAPYKGGGLIGGTMPIALGSTPVSLSSDLEWVKKANLKDALYSAGFAKSATAIGGRYAPAKGARVLELTSGIFHFLGGDLVFDPREQPFTLSDTNKIVATPVVPSFKAKINPATGLMSGSFRAGATGPTRKFSGAVLPMENRGAGMFLGTTESGQVLLEPVPAP